MKFKKIFLSVISCFILCSCSVNNETTDNYFQDDDSVTEINIAPEETHINNEKFVFDKNEKNDLSIKKEISNTETVDQTSALYAYIEQEKCLTVNLKNIGESSELPNNSEMAEILKIENLTNSSLNISSLRKLKNVQQIYINGLVDDLSFIENYNYLTNVYIEHFYGKLFGLYENPSVKKISIANSQIVIENIDKWNKLEEVYISNSDVIVSGNYDGFSKLKRFNAVCSCFEHNDLSFVENSSELIEFVYSPLKNVDLKNCIKLTFCNELKVLSLSGNIVDLNFLTELKNLELLTIITENYLDLSQLYENNSLNTVVISCAGYDNEKKITLIEKLPQCNWTIEYYDKIF